MESHVTKLFDIDLNLLVSLDAILTTHSVTAAAARVRLSKPAMSHALNRIRTLLGDEILVRSGKQWILTERARTMAGPLAEILGAMSRLVFASELEIATLAREFRIHTTDHVLSILGIPIGRAVGGEAPNVDLRFLPVLPDDVAALRDDVDLGIGVFPDLPVEFRKQKLFEDRFCCVVRRDHPQVRGRVTLKQYTSMHHVLVAPRGRAGGVADHALAQLGERRRVARALPYFLAALHCVAESDCVATISVRLARAHAERFGLQIVKPPIDLPPFDIEQIWHPRVEGDPAHAWLRRLVATVAHGLPRV
jgi:DNA-binding transcriptional LysR family regulator